MILPLPAGTHQQKLRTQGSVSILQEKMIRPPDCWDPPATSSHARKCLTVGTHPVEAYVALSFWSRTCTYILVVVEARTYTYVQRRGCKKENTSMYVHMGGVSNAYSHIRTAKARVHGCGWVGTEKLRRRRVRGEAKECVVFIWGQRNASCSWLCNGMRRVHREATKRVGASRLGRNGMRGHVHREGLDGTGDGNEAWRIAKRRKRTSYVRNGVLLTGRGVV